MSVHIKIANSLPIMWQKVSVGNDLVLGHIYNSVSDEPSSDSSTDLFTIVPDNKLVVGPNTKIPRRAEELRARLISKSWLGSYRLRWDSLKARSDWSEHAIWIVPVTREGKLLAPFNACADSLQGRWSRQDLFARRGWQSMLNVFVPHRHASPEECVISVNAHPDCPPQVTPQPIIGGVDEAVAATMPRISFSAPDDLTANGIAEILLQVHSQGKLMVAPCEVYLDAMAGYLPRRRVVVSGGEARIRFHALGLEPGDRARIKAGWKYWPGAAETEITIV